MTSIFNQPDLPPRARTTMDLLNMALETDNLRAWARRLDLSEEALRTARSRGRLSPMIAAALAEGLHQDPARWIAIAALEKPNTKARARRGWPGASRRECHGSVRTSRAALPKVAPLAREVSNSGELGDGLEDHGLKAQPGWKL